jgi:hypothetical protein
VRLSSVEWLIVAAIATAPAVAAEIIRTRRRAIWIA